MFLNYKMKKYFWLLLAILLIAAIIIIYNLNSSQTQSSQNEFKSQEDSKSISQEPLDSDTLNWMQIELKDLNTQETYTINSLNNQGKPILIESFAVWCPICLKQQNYIKELHAQQGYSQEELISINLGTDPNEDESQILQYANENDFDWIYSVSPVEMTQSLVAQFGPGIVNAPSAPIIIVCPDKTSFKVSKNGAKDVEDLQQELAKCGA